MTAITPQVLRVVHVDNHDGAQLRTVQDCVAEEVPVALEYNGISHAVMLATPADLEDFALGFSLTEDIAGSGSDVRDMEVVPDEGGITVRISIAAACFNQLKERRRSLAGRTGCGLCGTESLHQAVREPPRLQSCASFDAHAVRRAMQALRARQPLHAATGAVHAAAFANADGHLLLVREDVGRHNAVDKLVGAMAQARLHGGDGFVAVTSRASYEMVGKTVRAGAPLLCAVSGVTGLAIDIAQRAGLCLIGFARESRLGIHTHGSRVMEAMPHHG